MTDDTRARAPQNAVRGWFAVVLLVLLSVSSYLDRAVIAMMVDPIKADLGIGDFELSLLQGFAFALFYSICGLPIGWLVDRFPRRQLIFAGVSLWSIAAAAAGLARSYAQLFAARIGVGVGESTLTPAALSLIADLVPRRSLPLATALYTAGSLIGTAAAALLGGYVIGHFTAVGSVTLPLLGTLRPWQLTFIAVALPGLVLAPLIFLIREPRLAAVARHSQTTWRSFGILLWKRRTYFGCHFAGFSMTALLATALGAWYPTYLLRHFAMPIEQAGALIGLVTVACGIPGFIASGLIFGWLSARGDRAAQQRYGAVAATAIAIAGVTAFSVSNAAISLACYGLVMFFSTTGGAAVSHLQVAVPDGLRGRTIALFLLFYTLFGVGFGPSLVAAITDFVFRDPAALGRSLFWVFATVGPLSALVLVLGIRPAIRATIAAET